MRRRQPAPEPLQAGPLVGVGLFCLTACGWTRARPNLGAAGGGLAGGSCLLAPTRPLCLRGFLLPGESRPGAALAPGRCPCSGNPADLAQGSECVNKVLCTVSSLSLQGTGLAGGGGPPTWGHAVGRRPQCLKRSWGWGDLPCLTWLCGQTSCPARWRLHAPRPPVPEVCTQVDSTWARPEAKVWKRVENQANLRGSRDSKARLQRSQRLCTQSPVHRLVLGCSPGLGSGLVG